MAARLGSRYLLDISKARLGCLWAGRVGCIMRAHGRDISALMSLASCNLHGTVDF